jgi:hypothetical protein
MLDLPGYGWMQSAQNELRARGQVTNGSLADSRSFSAASSRLSETKGTNLFLEKTAKDWYEPLGLAREHMMPNGDISRHQNAVDAFRHAYTSGMLYAHTGKWAVNLSNMTEAGNPAGIMDRENNSAGVQLYQELEKSLGREPTEEEFAEHILEAVANGDLMIRTNNGLKGWEERVLNELETRRSERKEFENAMERALREPARIDALPPDRFDRLRERDIDGFRGFDRFEGRPGFGDGRTMYA